MEQSDYEILSEIVSILRQGRDIDCTSLQVEVEDSVVFLSGTVQSEADRIAIERIADFTSGVLKVENSLQVLDPY